MAKLLAFLVFACLELSWQDEVTAIEKAKDGLSEELTFPEQQLIHETYPLDTSLENMKDSYSKFIEKLEEFLENSKETDSDAYDDSLEEYFEVILDVEEWIMKAHPEFGNYKWLRILEEGGMAKGKMPECSNNVARIHDHKNSGLDIEMNSTELIEKYDKLVSIIEKWMLEEKPSRGEYKWLDIVEKEIADSCLDYDSDSYEDYYDIDIANFFQDKKSLKMKLSALRESKFKRFTSV